MIKKLLLPLLALCTFHLSFTRINKIAPSTQKPGHPSREARFVTGKVTNAAGNGMPGVKVVMEHTVWFGSYIYTTTDSSGAYKVSIPANPAGSWTVKAQVEKSAYGQTYTFDLHPADIKPLTGNVSAVKNFTWILSGKRPDPGYYYGAHVDLYPFGTDVPMDKVKLIFTPAEGETRLIDGTPAVSLERTVINVAGTFMVPDIPVGRYMVTAKYAGKSLMLDNRHDGKDPETTKTVVFSKNGYLAKTEYNIEFWLSQ